MFYEAVVVSLRLGHICILGGCMMAERHYLDSAGDKDMMYIQ